MNNKMNILFISSGTSKFGISPIVKNQGMSLQKIGLDVEFFTIQGGGIIGYINSIRRLKAFLRGRKFDIFHAHYSLSSFVATVAGCNPLVVSLMGSDVNENKILLPILHLFHKIFWKACIVKSADMAKKISPLPVHVIPNGVNLNRFNVIDKRVALDAIGFPSNKKNILFLANPARYEKNFALAQKAVDQLEDDSIALHAVHNIPNESVVNYMNASDCLILTSLWEGSPNVIKEAMACNCPIVSTNVGDVSDVIGATDGCYITSFEPRDVAAAITKALEFGKRTNGREQIKHLDEKIVAKKLLNLYQMVLKT